MMNSVSKILKFSMTRMASAMMMIVFIFGSTIVVKRCQEFAPSRVAALI